MQVQEGLRALRKALNKVGDLGSFAPAAKAEVEAAAAQLPLSAELREWYGMGAPDEVSIPWLFQEMVLYSPADLVESQVGYRWHGRDGRRLEDWPEAWVVIGDAGADPVIAFTDRPGTPVAMAMHGEGDWEPHLMAPDLGTFLAALGAWTEVAHGRFEGEFFDDDDEYREDLKEALEQRLRPLLPAECLVHWTVPT